MRPALRHHDRETNKRSALHLRARNGSTLLACRTNPELRFGPLQLDFGSANGLRASAGS